MQTLLIALDGSRYTTALLTVALTLLAPKKVCFTLLHVVKQYTEQATTAFDTQEADHMIDTANTFLTERGGTVSTTHVAQGDPGTEILAYAHANPVDIVLLRAPCHTTFLSQNVSQHVLTHCQKTVLIYRPEKP